MKLYAKTHEWIEVTGDSACIGISKHAADEMGDLTYIEVPEVGKTYKAAESFGSVESVKAASEIFSPVSGTVSAVNTDLEDDPAIVNKDPEGAGWICKMENIDKAGLDALMTEKEYLKTLD